MPSRIIRAFFLFLMPALAGCPDDLAPPSEAPAPVRVGTMTGVIRYANWDSAGTIYDLRLVAFRLFPPVNLTTEILAGRVFIHPALGDTSHLPYNVDSTEFALQVPVGTWQYLIVAQQHGPNQSADWRPVGQYDLDSNLAVPSSFSIAENDTTPDIRISVDFANLPPPPF